MAPNPSLPGLLKACLSFHAGADRTGTAASGLSAVDHASFENYFERHETQLAAPLFWHLKRRTAIDRLPPAHRATLERHYHRNLAKNAILEHALARVLAS